MYMFFDTETTGLPKNLFASTKKSEDWPHIVQLAYLVYSPEGEELKGVSRIIKPEGYTIPARVTALHGITQVFAEREGLPAREVLDEFLNHAEQVTVFVAHNIKFDEKVMRAEFHRQNLPNIFFDKQRICTMIASRKFSPGTSLQNLHNYLFHASFQGNHDAMADVTATAKCFWECRRRGLL